MSIVFSSAPTSRGRQWCQLLPFLVGVLHCLPQRAAVATGTCAFLPGAGQGECLLAGGNGLDLEMVELPRAVR